MKTKLRMCAVLVACVGGAMTAASAADPSYTVTPLDGLVKATNINNNGDVVGSDANEEAVLLFRGASTIRIPSLVKPSRAMAVNDNGQVVGWSTRADGTSRAFLYSGGVTRDLGTLAEGGSSRANDINLKGQVVGWSDYGGMKQPFRYENGKMTRIPLLENFARPVGAVAVAINDRGNVIVNGEFFESDGDPTTVTDGFLVTARYFVSVRGLGGHSRLAFGINANDWVVGTSEISLASRETHAIVYSGGTSTELKPGPGDSFATGINKAGQIVGYFVDANGAKHGFVYLSGLLHDLNSGMLTAGTEWYVQEAITINDMGQILAEGCPGTSPCSSSVSPIVLNPVATKTVRRR